MKAYSPINSNVNSNIYSDHSRPNQGAYRGNCIEDLFELTSTPDSTYNLKFRLPTFIFPENLLQAYSSFESYVDTFYDNSDFSYGKANQYIRERSIDGRKKNVIQFTVDMSGSCHFYRESPFTSELPPLKIVQFSYKRYSINELCYFDEVESPVNYKLITLKAVLSSKEDIQAGFTQILTVFLDMVHQQLTNDDRKTNLNQFLFANLLLPVPTKFMYVMKCANLKDYKKVFERKDLPSKFIFALSKYLVSQCVQNSQIKHYLWDMFEYPQFFALHYNTSVNHQDWDQKMIQKLNKDLEDWKNEFLEDDESTLVLDEEIY